MSEQAKREFRGMLGDVVLAFVLASDEELLVFWT